MNNLNLTLEIKLPGSTGLSYFRGEACTRHGNFAYTGIERTLIQCNHSHF